MSDPTDPAAASDAVRARIAAQVRGADERADAVAALQARIAATTATVRSPRGELEATARADGRVERVRIFDAAYDVPPEVLGRLITTTLAEAQRRAATAAIDDAAAVLGDASPIVAALRGRDG